MLEVQSLTLSFGGLSVLNDVKLSAYPGELTALIGPNGAGKSALLNCVSGHYRPSSNAHVLIDGTSVEHLPPYRRAKAGLSRTFQHIHLVPELTVLENVMTGLTPVMDDSLLSCVTRPFRQHRKEHERRQRAKAALTSFGLEDEANTPAGALPLGVRRRVDLVRATISEPKVLLLDEPASGMSRVERVLIPSWISEIQRKRQCTVIWIEHDIELLLSTADAVFVLCHGEIMAYGRPKENLGDREKIIEAYFARSEYSMESAR